MNEVQQSLEWHSVLDAVEGISIRAVLPTLDQTGIIAYIDGTCIKNPGGPAGWSALLWAAADCSGNGLAREGATCCECYGHIPHASTTTNNRAEIAAVLAVLSLAPPRLPLKVYSDSEYIIKAAQGIYTLRADSDLWELYRQLLGYRTRPPVFEWVRRHAGHKQSDLAEELAGLWAFNGDYSIYQQWKILQATEERTAGTKETLRRHDELYSSYSSNTPFSVASQSITTSSPASHLHDYQRKDDNPSKNNQNRLNKGARGEQWNTEIEEAEQLFRSGKIRAAGAVAGIALEANLKKLCDIHHLTYHNGGMRNIIGLLQDADIINSEKAGRLTRLAAIRNKCAHASDVSEDEVRYLVREAKKFIEFLNRR